MKWWILSLFLLGIFLSCRSIDRQETTWESHFKMDSVLVDYHYYDDGSRSRWEKAMAHGDTLFVGIYYVPNYYKKKFKVVIETESSDIWDWYLDPTNPLSLNNPANPGSPLYHVIFD